jgi:hypothetical protein
MLAPWSGPAALYGPEKRRILKRIQHFPAKLEL